MRIGQFTSAAMLAALALAGCAREEILPGERYDIRDPLIASLPADANVGAARPLTLAALPQDDRSEPISLGAAQSLGSWVQRSAVASHAIPHLALSANPQLIWAADIGAGNDRKHRITADPVVSAGLIYTLDSRARVTATSTGGGTVWSRDLTPASDKSDDASGGGLVIAGGKLFATTGFGEITAMDAATGTVLWVQKLDAVVTASPQVVGDTIYAVSRDNRGFAISTANGKLAWQISATPAPSGYVGGAGPASDGRIVVFPFAGGELVASLKNSGVKSWSTILSGQRPGRSYAGISDITGDPVIAGRTLYVGNASGRLMAANVGSGERLWTANEGTLAAVAVAGGSVFLVSDHAEVVRLNAETGERIWGTPLPNYVKDDKPRRRKEAYAHYGPLLAGGRVLVASTDGVMRFFDPASGAQAGSVAIPSGAASNPVIVGGVLYIVNAKGQLLAYR